MTLWRTWVDLGDAPSSEPRPAWGSGLLCQTGDPGGLNGAGGPDGGTLGADVGGTRTGGAGMGVGVYGLSRCIASGRSGMTTSARIRTG